MSDYSDDIAGAYEMVRDFGAPVTIRRPSRSGYDARTGTFTAPDAVDRTTGYAARVPASASAIPGVGGGEGRVPQTAESRELSDFLIPAMGLGFAPEAGHVLEFAGGDVWDVLSLETIAPDGTPILYIVNGGK